MRLAPLALLALTSLPACDRGGHVVPQASASQLPPPAPRVAVDEKLVCERAIEAVMGQPALPGTPAFDAARAEVLGRARGEPAVFVREPQAAEVLGAPLQKAARLLAEGKPGARVVQVIKQHGRDPAALRELLLREGYLYSADPHDALALVTELHLGDLFDAPEIVLERGASRMTLRLERVRGARQYRHVGGELDGSVGELMFGDRVYAGPEPGPPLHRDMRQLARRDGFERARIVYRTAHAMVAELRYDGRWVRALLGTAGAQVDVTCLDASEAERARVAAAREASKPWREALDKISARVTDQVLEALRFDRPEGEKTAERDGQLRPVWLSAYLRGAPAFVFEEHSYPVYDGKGRPHPPQVCVDFVLESYERASGTWFTALGEAPARKKGRLDFDELGIKNRRGVLGFMQFAEQSRELFEVRKFVGEERIPFGERSRFFEFLVEHGDELREGDVLAIQGRKRDGLIHQHAILLERTDPLTGFAYGLADQMKRPRRRTWEGIMAEAPLRSLLFRARPSDKLRP